MDNFVKVLAEWLFSAISSKVDDDDVLDLLVLYSWATSGDFDSEMVLVAIGKLNDLGFF